MLGARDNGRPLEVQDGAHLKHSNVVKGNRSFEARPERCASDCGNASCKQSCRTTCSCTAEHAHGEWSAVDKACTAQRHKSRSRHPQVISDPSGSCPSITCDRLRKHCEHVVGQIHVTQKGVCRSTGNRRFALACPAIGSH